MLQESCMIQLKKANGGIYSAICIAHGFQDEDQKRRMINHLDFQSEKLQQAIKMLHADMLKIDGIKKSLKILIDDLVELTRTTSGPGGFADDCYKQARLILDQFDED